eukprot:CAMPEP_0172539222 /NCGR_PEP_ID=MMETSP1067-20121228/10466_1 /TAXON_ID=265564 ORGANISM="Thalassiosira punctigera, Strain Tpunct2005C2" /NCGR_SAMPLE_ID=MMETSP1067 /ASSEMBLY_ACC=CAM_ASM_000444 /LENGTH=427 /DNA_ID=CAMNT_0013324869 /DNA_START=103 /DNA_END=1386 /DNA_ORIENTATION=-
MTALATLTVIVVVLPTACSFLLRPYSSSSFTKMRTATSLSSCVAQEARSLNLFSTTPLVHSIPLSKLCHPHPVYLKLDLLQQSGSFKDRGMAHLCATVRKVHGANHKQKHGDDGDVPRMKVISSSGGNAGLAVTTVARNTPGMDVSVVVPETTKPMVVDKLRSLGADVTVHGANWNSADALARQWVEDAKSEDGGGAVYVSPYDNPLLWTGHSTVVDEIITQLLESSASPNNLKIGAMLASVGGGGLLCGVFEGIERNYYGGNDSRANVVRGTKVVACETEGAESFAASFNASSGKKELSMVRLDDITSVATSLGALEVTPAVIQRAHRHQERGEGGTGEDVLSYVCTDAEAVDACVKFAAEHRMLVEPACGASLAPLYSERLRSKLLEELQGEENGAIVVEVCGGSGVNLDLLAGWKAQFIGHAPR